MCPLAQGLYNPAQERDSCGVGFVVNIKGKKSHQIVRQGLEVLMNLRHRGACGCEANTGDGAGILIQVPHTFLKKAAATEKVKLPGAGDYGVGMVYLPPHPKERRNCEKKFEEIIKAEHQNFLGWRTVPTDNGELGASAKAAEPVVRQIFVGRNPKLKDDMDFERKLYVIRKRAESVIRYGRIKGGQFFYISSLSFKTIVYKGMLMSEQVGPYFPDLADPSVDSALALVHSRFSTNTFPSWERAHPYRYICHNGEINTLRGNINWMRTRQAMLAGDHRGSRRPLHGQSPMEPPPQRPCGPGFSDEDLKKVLPVIASDGSDSAMFDNVLEFLTLSGRSLPHAMMMMIPEPWEKHDSMSREKKAFYEFHSSLMEPWDGPASIAFTDGVQIGAVLDRNGLRPSRYYVTKDGLVVMASEVGVLEIPPERVLQKGRLQPGRMLLIDTEQGRIIDDAEIKTKIAGEHPYALWLKEELVTLEELPDAPHLAEPDHATILQRQQAFGYTFEELKMLMAPMAVNGVEALGSMGDDTPLAVLSNRPHVLYDYFKQLFAQVTNPPIDAIREELVTAFETTIGPEANLLKPEPASCRQIKLKNPILANEELAKLRHIKWKGFSAVTLPILFDPKKGGRGLEAAMIDLYKAAEQAMTKGAKILILSDRGVDAKRAAIPALLAVAGLHHHLIRKGKRTKVGLVIETGEPREVHHFALLLGYGVGAINPYLAFETLEDMIREGDLTGVAADDAKKKYIKAVVKGVVKVLSKMGISTIQSYRGAQIFEAIGLNREVIDTYFTWTPSRIEGIGIETIAEEVRLRHARAYPDRAVTTSVLDAGGQYQWRQDGEYHMYNPLTIHTLQLACRTGNYQTFKQFSALMNGREQQLATLRGLLDLKPAAKPIPLDQVESVEAICRRFKTGAMSYGSISREAHESLAIAMNRIGGKSNTGEGGEDPARYTPDPNGDLRNSAIKQVASGRFGVTSEYLVNARELQIKMAQGAKPGEGGQLPGTKVYPWIAKVRYATPGVGLISPPPHHDIYSIEDLAQLIHDLKNANAQARVSVKLVSEVGVGTIAAGVAKAKADVVLISGDSGGTGASPQTSIKHAGLPWELGLAETHQTLLLNNLRSRIVVETDGQLKTGRDVAIACLLGAEEFGFATAPLITMGCIMMRVCHLNTCPVGVATQDPELRKKFTGDPQHAVNFMRFVAQELREVMAELGFHTINEMVGRTDRLEIFKAVNHWKAKGLDLSPLLYRPKVDANVGTYCQMTQDHGLDKALDTTTLLKICKPALEFGQKVRATLPIHNTNRVVGTIVGSEITKRHGPAGLPEDTIQIHFKGSAGQSFGAFMPKGMTFMLEGDCNDYIGKGLSGGKLIVMPAAGSTFIAEENMIIGNVAFYGATSGEAYIRGMAGERFCVRNSGVHAVVEAIGDHGCEYMTGGRVVVLGSTGRNFAAGMSGGIAYVLDEAGDFARRVNQDMVLLETMDDEDLEEVRRMIIKHSEYTRSQRAWNILSSWKDFGGRFVKVMPKDYKRVMETLKKIEKSGLSGDEAIMAAFWENAKDKARVSGN